LTDYFNPYFHINTIQDEVFKITTKQKYINNFNIDLENCVPRN